MSANQNSLTRLKVEEAALATRTRDLDAEAKYVANLLGIVAETKWGGRPYGLNRLLTDYYTKIEEKLDTKSSELHVLQQRLRGASSSPTGHLQHRPSARMASPTQQTVSFNLGLSGPSGPSNNMNSNAMYGGGGYGAAPLLAPAPAIVVPRERGHRLHCLSGHEKIGSQY